MHKTNLRERRRFINIEQGNAGFTTRIPKAVYLLKPRQLTESVEDIDRVHYYSDKIKLQNHVKEYDKSVLRRTNENPHIVVGSYQPLTKEELPRFRRRLEISGKSQSCINQDQEADFQRVSQTYTIEHKNSKCCGSCCKVQERRFTVSETSEDEKYVYKRDDERSRKRKTGEHRRKQTGLSLEEKSKRGDIPPVKLGMLTRQMESRYLNQVENQLYNAININVFKNGLEDMLPILIHIPPHRKATMHGIMAAIQERVRFPIGYAKLLYTMDGTKLIYSYQLKNHGEYVVATNLQKRFKPMQYGRRRTPLMMIGKQSKHIRNLKPMNPQKGEDEYTNEMTTPEDHAMIEERQQENDANRVRDSILKKKTTTAIVSLKKEMHKDTRDEVSNMHEDSMEITYCNAGVGTTCSHCNSCYFDKHTKEQHVIHENLSNRKCFKNISDRNKKHENNQGTYTTKTNSIGSQCDKSNFGKEYGNCQFEDEYTIPSSEIRIKKRYGINRELGNQKTLQGTYTLNSDEPSCQEKREGRYGKSKSSHKTNHSCTKKERLPQHAYSEGNQCHNREKIEKRRSLNKDEEHYSENMMKKVQYNQCSGDAPVGSVPLENTFTPNKTETHAKQNLLCTIPCGEGLSKLNVLPCFTYNLPSQTSQQTYMVQQHPPLQLQHQQLQLQLQPVQSPQIALGHRGILGVPDSWNQQIYLPSSQLIAAQMPTNAQFTQLGPTNFEIAPSSYSTAVYRN